MRRIETGILPGGSDLSEMDLIGIVSGSAAVTNGYSNIIGIVSGDLKVSQSSFVEIRGIISGNLIIEGQVTLYGIVSGDVFLKPGGKFEPQEKSTFRNLFTHE